MTDANERGHDPADHLSQKGVSDHLDGDRFALLPDPHPMKGPNRLSILPPESGEVTTSDEGLRSHCHRSDVELITDAECISLP